MTKKDFFICILWLLVVAGLFYLALILTLSFNLFSWSPKYNLLGAILIIVTMVLMASVFILAKYTQSKIEIWFSLLVSLVLMIFGFFVIYELYSETLSNGVFSRKKLSPHWFRISIFLVYLTPIISWLVYSNKNRVGLLVHDKME